MKKTLILGAIASIGLSSIAFANGSAPVLFVPAAAASPDASHFEVIGALGIANLWAADSWLAFGGGQPDKLVQTNNNTWNTFAAQLGLGYVYYFGDAQQYSEQTLWFPSVEPELNAYYLNSPSGIKGDVWRAGDPNGIDQTYKMPVSSIRAMLDGALTIVSHKHFSLYAIAGIGNAWNRIGYSTQNKDDTGCSDNTLSLNDNTTSNFVWEVGSGITYAFNNRVGLSLEYLYTDLGTTKTSAQGNISGTPALPVPVVPATIHLKAQTGLLGLHISL